MNDSDGIAAGIESDGVVVIREFSSRKSLLSESPDLLDLSLRIGSVALRGASESVKVLKQGMYQGTPSGEEWRRGGEQLFSDSVRDVPAHAVVVLIPIVEDGNCFQFSLGSHRRAKDDPQTPAEPVATRLGDAFVFDYRLFHRRLQPDCSAFFCVVARSWYREETHDKATRPICVSEDDDELPISPIPAPPSPRKKQQVVDHKKKQKKFNVSLRSAHSALLHFVADEPEQSNADESDQDRTALAAWRDFETW